MLRVSAEVTLELVKALTVLEIRRGEKARDTGCGEGDGGDWSEGWSGFEGVRESGAGSTAVALETHTGGSGDGVAE